MDIKTIRELTRLMRDNDLVELEVESSDLKVKLSKAAPQIVGAPAVVHALPAAPVAAAAPAAPAKPAGEDFSGCKEVISPIPGTVYLKPNPDAKCYVSVGDRIEIGQVVCTVEAMKVFNEIKAEVAGVVRKICVQDAQAVEYGTPLFLVA